MSNDEVRDWLTAGGAKAFAFENIGDTVSGEVVSAEVRQQTDINDGKPKFFDDGSPMRMLVIVLQTPLAVDDDDDGKRTIYLRGGNYTAVRGKGGSGKTALIDAMKRVGATDVETGAKITMQFSGEGKKANNAYSAPKLYTITYEPPTQRVSMDELL